MFHYFKEETNTVTPVYKDHSDEDLNVVCRGRWSLFADKFFKSISGADLYSKVVISTGLTFKSSVKSAGFS